MEEKKAQALFQKYAAGNCTEAEKALLESWYLQHSPDAYPDMSIEERLEDKQQILAALQQTIAPAKRNMLWPKMAGVAAVIFALISFGLYTYLAKNKSIQHGTTIAKADVQPGGNKAVLTLANGQTINLSSDKKGIVIKAGELAYNDGTQIKTNELNAEIIERNTITTPVGGQYQIILQDGTKVWLNAASSLSYPTRFAGKERKVEITGEAYFEVAHNKAMPFKVMSKGQTIEVLGTHFNVMAYENEHAITTTLLEGSVKVSNNTASKYLTPGQQAQVTGQHIAIADHIDLEEVISWKNGYFKFNEDIKGIMNKIARWYDIDVVYKPGVDLNQTFSGEVSKSRNVSVLLKVMELTGNVNFKIEGRRIIVMP
ncbi:MAG: FecR domain-containing protein [Candidatus Pedobacter colombiensis]|uniref:FecR domain-containing protein n=1 Tax=Candidatus Pedobacter colombiensis TaxID=3121371 RepID=A0AAJ5W7B6_9SPHI|nr:FecR domain-containing protein [Pedobacter sp.]WEK18463.1 MAG: FecR domain-containing protein [Pedobacter sp.]